MLNIIKDADEYNVVTMDLRPEWDANTSIQSGLGVVFILCLVSLVWTANTLHSLTALIPC